MIKRTLQTVKRFGKNQRGVAAIEFALMFPAMALLYFGMLDLTNFVSMNRRVTAASSVVADLVTSNKDKIKTTSIDDYFYASYQMLRPVDKTKVKVDLYNFQVDGPSPGGAKLRWSRFSSGSAACGAAPQVSNLTPLMTKNNDLVVARVCYSYKPLFGAFLGDQLLGNTNITLTKNIYERPRLSDNLLLE